MAVPVSAQVRVPPHDLEAETSVLGAILLDPAAITRVLDVLNPDDFYRENNGQIFRAALNLFREGEPIDNITLAAELGKLGVLERVGGRAHLALIQEAVPTAANVEHYARIVKDKAYKRRLITAGSTVTGLGFDDSLDAEEAVNQAQAHVYAISDDRTGTGMERLADLLMPAMDRIDAQMTSGGAVIGIPSGFHDLDRMTNGFKAADLIIIAGRPSMGKCLTAATLIVDPATGGRLTIEEAVRRRLPAVFGISERGVVRPARVAAWVDSGVQETWRVRTASGRAVEVTGHHPFLTADGWQPLHDIRLGDEIAVPRRLPCFGVEAELDLARVRLLAYVIAEGGPPEPSRGGRCLDPEIVADFHRIVDACYPGSTWPAPGVGEDPLGAWLRQVGVRGQGAAARGLPAGARCLPDCAWRWDRVRLATFLRCLVSCDGTIDTGGEGARIELPVASERLARDVQHALVRFGILAGLGRVSGGTWAVEVREPRSVAVYEERIGWVGEKARRRPRDRPGPPARLGRVDGLARGAPSPLPDAAPRRQLASTAVLGEHAARLASPDLHWDPVVAIEPVGPQRVFDLTVPDGRNFVAQDVVVHNTSFALNVTLHAAVQHKKAVAIFSLEMSKEQLVERMLCEQARIDAQRLHRGTLSDVEYERLAGALGPLGDAPIFIDDSPMLDDLTMRLKARQARSREGIELVVLDYLQLMHGRSRGDDANRVQEVSAISRALKSIARELKIPVIAISQLSRAPEARPDKRPILSDLRESGSIEQDADIVVFLYRDEYYNREKTEKPGIAEVLVAKHRNGPTGSIELVFRKELTRFENLERRRPEPVGPDR